MIGGGTDVHARPATAQRRLRRGAAVAEGFRRLRGLLFAILAWCHRHAERNYLNTAEALSPRADQTKFASTSTILRARLRGSSSDAHEHRRCSHSLLAPPGYVNGVQVAPFRNLCLFRPTRAEHGAASRTGCRSSFRASGPGNYRPQPYDWGRELWRPGRRFWTRPAGGGDWFFGRMVAVGDRRSSVALFEVSTASARLGDEYDAGGPLAWDVSTSPLGTDRRSSRAVVSATTCRRRCRRRRRGVSRDPPFGGLDTSALAIPLRRPPAYVSTLIGRSSAGLTRSCLRRPLCRSARATLCAMAMT